MSLDDELRTTLGLEAELRTAPPPDVVGLIHGGRVRRRRRTLVRAGSVLAATVAIGVATFGLVTLDPRAEGDVVTPPSPTLRADLETLSDDGRATLEPGSYRMFVGHDAAGAAGGCRRDRRGTATGSTETSPSCRTGPARRTPASASTSRGPWRRATGATPTRPYGPLAQTPAGLAAQLVELPRSTVLQGPARARVVGLGAVHLRLRIEVDCPTYYRVAHAAGGTRGITYTPVGLPVPDVVIDFWVLDVRGTVVVIDEWHNTERAGEHRGPGP